MVEITGKDKNIEVEGSSDILLRVIMNVTVREQRRRIGHATIN